MDRKNTLGASLTEGGIGFRVWAPRCCRVEVVVNGRRPVPLEPVGEGDFEVTLPGIRPGSRYLYRLDGQRARPDPASRWQPDGARIVDVVYSHLGPEGNYLSEFGPYFSERDRFVIFLQNHDQVGNRARGERLGRLVGFEALKLLDSQAPRFGAPAPRVSPLAPWQLLLYELRGC